MNTDARSVALPVGDKDTKRVSLHIDETAPHRALVLTDPFADGEATTPRAVPVLPLRNQACRTNGASARNASSG